MESKKNNLYVLFDYVYYTIAYQYYKWNQEEVKEFSGIIGLSSVQFINIIVVLMFFNINLFNIICINPLFVILGGSFLLSLINGIRYKKIITYDELHKKWGNDNKKSNFIKKAIVLFYIIMTMVTLIISFQW